MQATLVNMGATPENKGGFREKWRFRLTLHAPKRHFPIATLPILWYHISVYP